MPTYNADLLPNSTGLNLGSAIQQWDAYIRNLNGLTRLISASANSAAAGVLSLASTDTINWKNFANNADVILSKTGAANGTVGSDVLVWSGTGIEAAAFIDNSTTPASAGQVRLGPSATVKFRNNALTGDVQALAHNSDDTLQVGDSQGIKLTTLQAVTAVVTGTANVGALTGPNTGGSFGISSVNGATLSITSDTNQDLTITGGGSGSINLNSTTGTLKSNTKFSNYGGIATTGQGVAPQYATVDLTGQTAAITTTTLYSVPASGAGQYRLSWNAKITTVGSVSSTLGALTIGYTDPDGVAVGITAGTQLTNGTVATTATTNSLTTAIFGLPLLLNCKASTNISYAMAYVSNAASSMTYNLHLKLEFLG